MIRRKMMMTMRRNKKWSMRKKKTKMSRDNRIMTLRVKTKKLQLHKSQIMSFSTRLMKKKKKR